MGKEEVINLSEKEVQHLIADYPWLLNLDYEIVTELKNKGIEYRLTDNKRADLILRDKKSGRPVIVEFKKIPFNRENIGQILEYKARIIQEYTSDNSILRDIFEEKILVPIMVLVVPSCTAEARLACNLSNIDIYEYNNKTVSEIMLPEKKKSLEEFKKSFINEQIPFSINRDDLVDRVYKQIYELLLEENLIHGWTKYKNPPGEYFITLNHLFINKQIFKDYEISIGIVEDIFNDSNNNKIIIEYYSQNLDTFNRFIDEYKNQKFTLNNDNIVNKEDYNGYCWSFYVDKNEFLKDTKKIIKPFIINYINVMKILNLMD